MPSPRCSPGWVSSAAAPTSWPTSHPSAQARPPELVEGPAWPPWYPPSTSNCLPQRSTANWTGWWNNSGSPFPRWRSCWRTPRRTSWPSRPSQWPTGRSCGQQPAGTAEPRDQAPESLPPKGDVVGIFPNRLSARRLVGAVLAEQHDEWAEARRYLTPSPTPPATRHCRRPICWTLRPDQHQKG